MKAIGLINIYGMVIYVKTSGIRRTKTGTVLPTLQIRDAISIPANCVTQF